MESGVGGWILILLFFNFWMPKELVCFWVVFGVGEGLDERIFCVVWKWGSVDLVVYI